MDQIEIPTCIVAHDDFYYLAASIKSFLPAGPVVVFISRLAFDGTEGPCERCVTEAESAGAEVVLGNWPNESLHRKSALKEMKKRGYRYCFVADGDEIATPELLSALVGLARSGAAARIHCRLTTFWKSPEYVVRPPEALTPVILIDLVQVKHVRIREFTGGTKLVLDDPGFPPLLHLSYCGPNERILRKIGSWSHKHEVVPGWYEQKWLAWDTDRTLENLHPTHPGAYKRVERIEVPEALAGLAIEEREEIVPCIPWPTVSVVIPLHGGPEDIRLCLASLALLADLIHETIVVDDASPDKAAIVAESFAGVKVIRSLENRGFAATCNEGYLETSGDVVIFLNSDTAVPKHGLIRLVESLMASGNIAAAGPSSNNTGHHQQISSTYESLATMPLFSEDLANSDQDDADVDMLVGFCLAAKRTALEELGLFDLRYGIGMYEETDWCFRARRAGFRLVHAKRAFVHHAGSRSLARRKEHPAVLLSRNQALYQAKWQPDISCRFASHLSGMSPEPIVFDQSRKPEELDKRLKRLAKKANVCLVMIVKNEKRVLGACLESVKNAFTQRVIVDTGSTDGTQDIARSYGVELFEIPWSDSFSESRNAALRHVRTPWWFWCDADDTISRDTLERMLRAVIDADPKVGGFVIPVRFVDEGPNGGTQVNHVKLVRSAPGICFEGRVHEQVLPSIRRTGKEIVRLQGAVVQHSGYDTSIDGQARKRAREEKLLKLDDEENPGHPFKSFNIAMTAHYMKEHEKAIEWMARSIAASGPGESHLRKAYALMGVSKRELGDLVGALETFGAGLLAIPGDPELLFQSAVVLTSLRRFEEAKDCYLRVGPDTSGHFSSVDVGILTFKRFHNLGTVCIAMDDYTEAKSWWLKAIEVAPTFSPSAMELYESAMARRDFLTAQEGLNALMGAEGPSENWANRMCRLAGESGQDPEYVLRVYMQTHPYAMGPLLVLARMLIARGDDAGPILTELDRLGSAEGAFFRGVAALGRADLWAALEHMGRALELNPSHEPTENHLKELRRILVLEAPEVPGTLVGSHVGALGPGSCPHSVVVVTYNSVCTIGECVERVLATLGPEDELILVDNASTDGTQYLIHAVADKRVRVLLNKENLGYSKAANLGLLASKGNVLVTLNPDAYVGRCWLECMGACLTDGVAAVGPMSDNVGGDQFVGHILGDRHPPVEELALLLAREFPGVVTETKFLVGICVMVRRETLDQHGLLDEGAALGADDLEFSWRMRCVGLKLAIAQDVFVSHEQGVSFSSLSPEERVKKQGKSDAYLARKMEAYYGKENLPSSQELWGTPIFDEAMARVRLLGPSMGHGTGEEGDRIEG